MLMVTSEARKERPIRSVKVPSIACNGSNTANVLELPNARTRSFILQRTKEFGPTKEKVKGKVRIKEKEKEVGKEKARLLVKDRGNTGPRQGQEKAVGKIKEKEKEKVRKEEIAEDDCETRAKAKVRTREKEKVKEKEKESTRPISQMMAGTMKPTGASQAGPEKEKEKAKAKEKEDEYAVRVAKEKGN